LNSGSNLHSMAVSWMSAKRYQQVARTAFFALYTIIVTGSLVRLTGSGLGCSDWPNCNNEKFVDVSSGHAAIEQVNRLFTGFVALSVVVAVSGALVMRPRIARLVRNALLLVVGVLAQVILGAYVVLTGLNPWSNMAHFLVSVLLVSSAFVLLKRVETLIHGPKSTSHNDVWLRRLILVAMSVFLGTVVTGAGPHSGSELATRLDISVRFATQIHSLAVWLTVLLSLVYAIRVRRSSSRWIEEGPAVMRLVGLLVVQGFIGYVQYFAGVPAQLVAIHVGLSVAVFLAAFSVFLPTSTLAVLD
jgi:cytochrome c oxidase assembly protein subunit 15